MKKIIIITLFLSFACKAQTPIYGIRENKPSSMITNNSYKKDIYNDFNKFIGTWSYTNGNKVFSITFQKRTMFFDNFDNVYKDLLIAEYTYSENGVILVNTLSNINNTDPYECNISYGFYSNCNSFPLNSDCISTDTRIKFAFSQPDRLHIDGYMMANYREELGEETLDIYIWQTISFIPDNSNLPTHFTVPIGEHMLFTKL
ncbi:DUF6705 family protein [Flavobacterium ponti]|uniref:DUF6705 family protein n=1 Tax=Flavobacterium ponti TaxID=665133 RepID=A0ABV9P5W8_9FLAO